MPEMKDEPDRSKQILGAWRRHNETLLLLLKAIPAKGLVAVPEGSRGRDVARQLAHLYRVRTGWVAFHRTGKRPKVERFDKGEPPSKGELQKLLKKSGAEVETFLREALEGSSRLRNFGRDPVRWMSYLISHESHHRGQIMLALKQSGIRLPDKVAIEGLWGRWIFGE